MIFKCVVVMEWHNDAMVFAGLFAFHSTLSVVYLLGINPRGIMETALDYVTRLWPVGLGFVGLVAWLVRVDGRTMQTAKNLERMEKENSDEMLRLENRIDARRKEDMTRISEDMREIKADIKTLLQRGQSNGQH